MPPLRPRVPHAPRGVLTTSLLARQDFMDTWKKLPNDTPAEKLVKKLSMQDQRELMCIGGAHVQKQPIFQRDSHPDAQI